MNRRIWIPMAAAVALLGCFAEKPYPFANANLGIQATFPGEPNQATYPEPTPFGKIEWHTFAYTPPGRLDINFHIDVGNLPPGTKGGDTVPVALATYEAFLGQHLGGPIQRTDLPASRGAGFQYTAPAFKNARVEGVVILKRGRLHHAQATVVKPNDPRVRTFLDSFAVN